MLSVALAAAVLAFVYLLGFMTRDHKWFPTDYLLLAKAHVRSLVKPPRARRVKSSISTVFLRLHLHRLKIPMTRSGDGGALTSVGDELLLLTHEGTVFAVSGLTARATGIALPDNGFEAYKAAAATEKYLKLRHHFDTFRYNDILYYRDDNASGLILSYTEWLPEQECYATAIAHLTLPRSVRTVAEIEAHDGSWEVVYRTQPCLPLKSVWLALDGGLAGGRIAYYPPNKVVMGSGDYGWDGNYGPAAYAQVTDNDYGKVLEIDLAQGTARTLSMGHRNVQGILVDEAGQVWALEHGPRGGDELNRIEEGRNFGWPETTLGTRYNGLPWPTAKPYGRHERFDPPTYAWVPSQGMSNITQIRGFDPSWDGDFLAASLAGQTLFRLRLEGDRVLFSEPIEIGERIRYAHQHTDGRIVLWTDARDLIFISREDTPTGVFIDQLIDGMAIDDDRRTRLKNAVEACAQCHSFDTTESGPTAPSLVTVFERSIASSEFELYSDALRARSGAWTAKELSRYLADPNAYAPGTTMPSPNVDPELIDDLIQVLQALKRPE
jgi:aldose sugar dehydrogenase